MTKRILALLLAVLMAVSCFALTACGDEEKKPNDDNKPPVNNGGNNDDEQNGGNEENPPVAPSVMIFNETITLVEGDDPYAVDQWVYVSAEGELTVTYESSNTAAFTVSDDGTITPVAAGEGKVTVIAKAGDLETKKEANVVIREMWKPTDPDTAEVVEIMRNKELTHAPLTFYTANFSGDKNYGTGNDPDATPTTGGPIEIWGDHLHILFTINKGAEETVDATLNIGKEEYAFSFQLYIREYNEEDDRTNYSKVDTKLVPWGVNDDPNLTIYRVPFYNSNLLDYLEVNGVYDLVIVIYENDQVRGWCRNNFTYTDSCEKYIEVAEQNASIVK